MMYYLLRGDIIHFHFTQQPEKATLFLNDVSEAKYFVFKKQDLTTTFSDVILHPYTHSQSVDSMLKLTLNSNMVN